MPIEQSDIDALKKAIVSAELSVTFSDGRRVDYRSVAEMKEALAFAVGDVATQTSGGTPVCKSTFAGVTRY